jgi:hypothetical protein
VELQEFCRSREEEILKKIEEVMSTAEQNKLTREGVEQMIDEILVGFQLTQPSKYFIDHPTDDVECIVVKSLFVSGHKCAD